MRAPERGMSLVELKVALAILAFVLLSAWTALVAQQRADRTADGYAADILGCRRALECVEADLRAARAVDLGTAGVVRIETAGGIAEYRLGRGVLERVESGRVRVLAGNLSSFEVTPDRGGFRVSLGPGRRDGLGNRDARIATTVHPRVLGGGP